MISVNSFRRGCYIFNCWPRNYKVSCTLLTNEYPWSFDVSIGTLWALFSLAQEPKIQAKLRDELLTVDTNNPTMDQLNALPYLDMVVRETMRLHPPVMASLRVSEKDDILPLSAPIVDRSGKVLSSVRYFYPHLSSSLWLTFTVNCSRNRIKKGQMIMVPIAAINRDKSIWGEDAYEFRRVLFLTVYPIAPYCFHKTGKMGIASTRCWLCSRCLEQFTYFLEWTSCMHWFPVRRHWVSYSLLGIRKWY
jgi:hypothetical protein